MRRVVRIVYGRCLIYGCLEGREQSETVMMEEGVKKEEGKGAKGRKGSEWSEHGVALSCLES